MDTSTGRLQIFVDGRSLTATLAPYPGVVEASVFGHLMSNEIFDGSDMVQVNT
jgi:hypothetical protein